MIPTQTKNTVYWRAELDPMRDQHYSPKAAASKELAKKERELRGFWLRPSLPPIESEIVRKLKIERAELRRSIGLH